MRLFDGHLVGRLRSHRFDWSISGGSISGGPTNQLSALVRVMDPDWWPAMIRFDPLGAR